MNSPLSKAGSPLSRTRRQTGASGTVADARQSRVEPGMVERLFSEGKALCDVGRYDEAEDKWKQVLQVARSAFFGATAHHPACGSARSSLCACAAHCFLLTRQRACHPRGWQLEQNDTRTLLHYAVMLRDKVHDSKKDPERAEQLLQQAMGESNIFVSIGLTSPARSSELAKQPKLRSPKKDIERWEFRRAGLRSHVEFHDLKTLRRQIQAMEDSTAPEHEEDEEGDYEDDELDSPVSVVQRRPLSGEQQAKGSSDEGATRARDDTEEAAAKA